MSTTLSIPRRLLDAPDGRDGGARLSLDALLEAVTDSGDVSFSARYGGL